MCTLTVYCTQGEHPYKSMHRLFNAYKSMNACNITPNSISIKFEKTTNKQSTLYEEFIERRKIEKIIKLYSTQSSFPFVEEWFKEEYPKNRYDHIPLVSFMKDIISQQAHHLTLDNFIEE